MTELLRLLRDPRLGVYRRWLPLLIILLAAVLRFHLIEHQSLWNDEGNSLRLAERTFPALIEAAARDIHPPGYYLLLKVWITVAGESEFSLRALSAFLSVLAAAFVYGLGKRLYAPGVGLMAALFVAINGFQIYYAQEARMYSMLTLCAAGAMWAFTGWSARPNLRDALLLALFNAAGLYTQYAFPVVMVVQGILFIALIFARRIKLHVFRDYVLLNLLTIALFLPLLPTALRQVTQWPRTGQPIEPFAGLAIIARWLVYGESTPPLDFWAIAWPVVLILAALLPDWVRKRQPSWWRILFPFLWIIVTVTPFFALNLFREANLKFLLPLQIAVALLIGRGAWNLWELGTANFGFLLEGIPRIFTIATQINGDLRMLWRMTIPNLLAGVEAIPRLIAIIAVMNMLSIAGDTLDNLYHNATFARDDYRGIAQTIMNAPRTDDAIILDAPNQNEVFSYYYKGSAPVYELPAGLGGDDNATRKQVLDVISRHHRIFVLYWGEAERDPNHVVEGTLNNATYPVQSRYYGDVRFVIYSVLDTPPDAPAIPINKTFGGIITLDGAALTPVEPMRGDVLAITLFWRTEQPISKRYKVFLHLLDSNGKIAAQRDSEPGGGAAITTTWKSGIQIVDQHGLSINPTLSSGEYRLIVGLYDLDNPTDRLKIGEADFIELGRLTVR